MGEAMSSGMVCGLRVPMLVPAFVWNPCEAS